MKTAWCGLLLGLTAAGCARGGPSSPVAEFPDRAKLSALRRSAPADAAPDATQLGDLGEGFVTETLPPGTLGDRPREPVEATERLLVALLPEEGKLKLTEETQCAARELGRFFLQRQRIPANRVRRFVLGRCGSLSPTVGVHAASAEFPESVSDADAFEQWRPRLEQELGPLLREGAAGTVGLWMGRKGQRAVVLLAQTRTLARLKPVDPQPDDDGWVKIEGVFSDPSGGVSAQVNRGQYGVAPCQIDLREKLPAFRVYCQLDDDDDVAEIEVYTRAPRRVLGRPAVAVLARRSHELPTEFRLGQYGDTQQVQDPKAFAAALLTQLNAVRERAGLAPLSAAPEQSKSASELAPHFMASSLHGEHDLTDTIALGLLAGWDVKGTIRNAAFLFTAVAPSRDVAQFLGAALASPMGRATLLDPQARQLAIGPLVLNDPGALAATLISYRFHDDDDHEADVNYLFGRVVHARKRMGLPAPKRLGPLIEPMQEQLTQVRAGGMQPSAAIDRVLEIGVSDLRRSMRGYQLEVIDLDAVEIPDEVLRAPELFLEIGVTHHKPEGAAWGQYVILIAYVDPGKKT